MGFLTDVLSTAPAAGFQGQTVSDVGGGGAVSPINPSTDSSGGDPMLQILQSTDPATYQLAMSNPGGKVLGYVDIGGKSLVYQDPSGNTYYKGQQTNWTPQQLQTELSNTAIDQAKTVQANNDWSANQTKAMVGVGGLMLGGAALDAGLLSGLTSGTTGASTAGGGAMDTGGFSGLTSADTGAGTTAAGGTALQGSGVTDEMLLTGQAPAAGGTAAGDVATGFSGAGAGLGGAGVPTGTAAAGAASGLSSLTNPGLLTSLGQVGIGAAGLATASGLKSSAAATAASVDPFGPNRAQYATQLNALMADPSGKLTSIPGYQAGLEAVERSGASQGWTGSGNMMAALQQYGGSFYQQQLQNLMQLSGANWNNAPAAGQIAQQGQTNAASITASAINPLVTGATGLINQMTAINNPARTN